MLCDVGDRRFVTSEDVMKAQDFQALVEQLGDLSQVQREALVEALTATDLHLGTAWPAPSVNGKFYIQAEQSHFI